MDERFELPVVYKGENLLFPAQLKQYGYTHRFAVQVQDREILFEPDEEGAYRALIAAEEVASTTIDVELLQAIAGAIETVLR